MVAQVHSKVLFFTGKSATVASQVFPPPLVKYEPEGPGSVLMLTRGGGRVRAGMGFGCARHV